MLKLCTEIAQTVISDQTPRDANGKPINPLDAHFANLNLKSMDAITPSSSEYEQLQEYITSTHGRTHAHLRHPTIQHAFRVDRHGEGEAWSNEGYDKLEDGERLLLWHGSRSTNFGGTSIPRWGKGADLDMSLLHRYFESRIAHRTS